VEISVPSLGTSLRLFVLPAPIDAERIDLVLAVAGHGVRGRLACGPVFRIVRREVEQDIAVWTTRRYLPRPALAKGDGPIAEYRRWASQFYAASV
jgi:hypothetical protein